MSTEPSTLDVSAAPDVAEHRGAPWWVALVVVLGVCVLLVGGVAAVLARMGRPLTAAPLAVTPLPETLDANTLRKHAGRAAISLEKVRPRGLYVVVDTYRNRLRIVRDGQQQREAVCSTGTGIVLRDPRNGKQWVFDTPLGERKIERKTKGPVWSKPDWAFVEEGLLPPKDPAERLDPNSLGDFALYMGDGYIIHGTLFKSLLGRRVTHGCIRLGDEDLEYLYKNAAIGDRVYLY